MSLFYFYVTRSGVQVFVSKGVKSRFNFKVRYREPGERLRTPKHIHLAVDLLIKRSHKKELTAKLCNYLTDIFLKIKPSDEFPPKLQFFKKGLVDQFKGLDGIGDYSVEFLLVVGELIMIQEITNRASELNREPTIEERKEMLAYKVYNAVHEDIFAVVSAATYKGAKAVT